MKVNKQIQNIKSKKVNYGLSFFLFFIAFVISVLLMLGIPKILDEVSKTTNNEQHFNFINALGKNNYVALSQTKDIQSREDDVLRSMLDLTHIADADKGNVVTDMKAIVARWKDSMQGEFQNVEYFIRNEKTGNLYYNKEKLSEVFTNPDTIEQLEKEYALLVVVTYDATGTIDIRYSKGIESEYLKNELDGFKNNRSYIVSSYFYDENNQYTESATYEQYRKYIESNPEGIDDYSGDPLIKNPTNLTVVCGVPNQLKYADSIYWEEYYGDRSQVSNTVIAIIMVAMAVFAIILLFIPYRKEKDLGVIRQMIQIPIEILMAIWFFLGLGIIYVIVDIIPALYLKSIAVYGSDFEWLKSLDLYSPIVFWIGVSIIFICMYFVIFFVVWAKFVIKGNLFTYLKEYSLFIRAIRCLGRILKKPFTWMAQIDLSKEGANKLVLIFLIHTIITVFLCCTWFIGAFLAIVYNFIIFISILMKYNKMVEDYKKMVDRTQGIADGDLETSIEDNVGIFNPLKEKINNIRAGLKKAVEEEVKSQNMKTELITNVSHDLKTPLTSIITYVDLLRDQTLTKEQQREYIDILDRKSQRLKVLIEDLFEMSKTASNNIVLDYMNIDMVTLTKEVLVEFQDKLEQANLMVKPEYKEEKIICYLDNQKTYRIIENLMGNIVKYAMPNTRVYVQVFVREEQAVLVFKNISATEIEFDGNELLERFVRGDASRNTEGSGLGLAIAKGLTEAQNGNIDVEVDGDLFKVTITFALSTVEDIVAEPMEESINQEIEETKWNENDWTMNFYTETEPVIFPEDEEDSTR